MKRWSDLMTETKDSDELWNMYVDTELSDFKSNSKVMEILEAERKKFEFGNCNLMTAYIGIEQTAGKILKDKIGMDFHEMKDVSLEYQNDILSKLELDESNEDKKNESQKQSFFDKVRSLFQK